MKKVPVFKIESTDERMTDSRERVINAMYLSLGAYVKQEGKKLDSWRDQTYGQLYAHLKHELSEIERSTDRTIQLHNAMDACVLSALLVCKLMPEPEKKV